MKALEFKTSKGKFILIENTNENSYPIDIYLHLYHPNMRYDKYYVLRNITEEETKEIVEYDDDLNIYLCGHHDIVINDGSKSQLIGFIDPIKSFYKLLESNGVFFENTLGDLEIGLMDIKSKYDCAYHNYKWTEKYNDFKNKWHYIESNLWNKSKTILVKL